MKRDYKTIINRRFCMGVFRWILLLIVSFIILLPVWWIVISSITPSGELYKTPIDYFPNHVTLDSYIYLIRNLGLLEKVKNTVIIVGTTLVVVTVICSMAAYAFSRFATRGISLVFGFIIATMLLPEAVMARSLYELIQKVGLYDTRIGLILLYVSGMIPFTVLVLSGFVRDIPIELEEAAAIDGASFLQRLFWIVVPLLRPAIATICIINFVTGLNTFFVPLFYASRIQPLSVAILQLPLKSDMISLPWDLVSAMACVMIVPIIIFVAIFEEQIMDGIMAGGVKN